MEGLFSFCISYTGWWHIMKTHLRICKMTGTISLLPYIAVGEETGDTRIDEQMLHIVILDYIILL